MEITENIDRGFGGPFWERKLKTYFRRMDSDGDGVLTKKDFDRFADRYVEFGKLDGVKAKQAHRKLMRIWYDFLEPGSINGQCDSDTYVQNCRERKAMIPKTSLQFHGLFFDLIDINGDGVIQKEEFELWFKVFGIEDKQVAHQSFSALDTNGDGQLSYDEFTHAGYQYFFSGDESLPSKLLYGPLVD